MKTFFSSTIRRMTFAAVVLCVLPPLVILLLSGAQRYREIHDDAARRGARVVEGISDRLQLVSDNTLTILSTLRTVAALRDFSSASSDSLFRDIASERPLFGNIFIMAPSGKIISSGVSVPPDMTLSHTALPQLAASSKSAVVLPVAASPFTGAPALHYVLPLTSGQGSAYAYLGAELRLRFLDRVLAGQPLPYMGTVFILSNSGMLLLSSSPDPKARPGQFIGAEFWNALRNRNDSSGVVFYEEKGGKACMAAYNRLALEGSHTPYLYTVLTVPVDSANALSDFMLRRDMLLLAAGAAFALLAGFIICRQGLIKPVRTLLRMTERLSRDESIAAVGGEKRLSGEFADLGREFNAMAESLEERSAALERDREAAAKSSRAKSEFLANMSHEIRTPMNAILGMTHLVGRTNLTDPQRAQVTKIHDAADSLLQLLNNILDFSKMEAGKMQVEHIPFHTGRLLNTMRGGNMEKAAAAGTHIVTNIPAEVPPLLVGDPTRLGQALSILLEEAIRNSQGHPVEIGGWTEDNDGKAVTVHFTKTVRGTRLDDEQLDAIRRCLSGQSANVSRLDNRELSLLLAGSIMRLIGGQAFIENLKNGFELDGAARLDLPEAGIETHNLRFDGERVLLLSSHNGRESAIRERREFSNLLLRYNLRSEECDSEDEAVQRLREADRKGSPFAMVVADMPPPAEAARYIERLKHGLALSRPPLLILTAGPDTRRLPSELANSGIDAFLSRPFNESMLVNTLSGLLRDSVWGHKPPSGAAAEEEYRLDGLSVLLAEDNIVNQEIAVELLQNAGALVRTAANGIQAVEQCRRSPRDFDLVLMDLEMPGMGGIAATRVLRAQAEFTAWRLPIIAMTAHNSPDEVALCLEAGMNDHILKPIVLSHFFTVLQRWLAPDAAKSESALRALRKMRHILMRSHPRDVELLRLLDELVPWLHGGRVDALRDLLEKQNGTTALAMIDDYLTRPASPPRGRHQD